LPRQSPTLPQGLEGGNPLCVKIFLGKSLPPKRLSCFPAISVTEPRETNKSACKQQGRPSRGTPTPPGYEYLTRHLPRKITLTRISDSATDEQVRILETGGKETQLYNTTIKCSGLGGRERHIHVQNKLLQQNQASPGEEWHPRLRLHPQRRFHPWRDPPWPWTATQAEGFPPRRRTPAPRLGPRRPRQAAELRPGQLHLRREDSTPR
jgi:hypothetical protein